MDPIAQHRVTRRCPVCFSRETDVLLIHEGDDRYYCVKCSFRGSEAEIYAAYRDIQKKYHWMPRRVTLEQQQSM